MSRYVFDIETTAIADSKAETMHCIVMQDIQTMEVTAYHDYQELYPKDGMLSEGVDKLAEAHMISGHNICGFDIPTLKEIARYEPMPGCITSPIIGLSNEQSSSSSTISLKLR